MADETFSKLQHATKPGRNAELLLHLALCHLMKYSIDIIGLISPKVKLMMIIKLNIPTQYFENVLKLTVMVYKNP